VAQAGQAVLEPHIGVLVAGFYCHSPYSDGIILQRLEINILLLGLGLPDPPHVGRGDVRLCLACQAVQVDGGVRAEQPAQLLEVFRFEAFVLLVRADNLRDTFGFLCHLSCWWQ